MRNLVIILAGLLAFACTNRQTGEEACKHEAKIDSLLDLMTLEEKIGMIHASSSFTSGGVERLGIPELVMSDGPHGIRFEHGRDWEPDRDVDDSASYLPTGICLAATWNPELAYEFGAVLGREARHRGKDVLLGPGINIIRSPLNGRNFEYMSEDPLLSSRMAEKYICGVQDQGVAACVKHYIANNQETNRKGIDVIMSEQALREIYLPAFRASVEAGVMCVMGSYNRYGGQYCTHHEYLVNDLLKGELGFKGVLMSDWSSVQDTREALLFGTDIEMGTDLTMLPNPDFNRFYLADSALAMIRRGEVSETVVDEKLRRILGLMFRLDIFAERQAGAINTPQHQQTALRVAEEGIVLLKNEGILPLNEKEIHRLLLVGDNAVRRHAHGGGSSQVNTKYEVTPQEGIKKLAAEHAEISFVPGYEVTRENTVNTDMIEQAAEKAQGVDAVIIVGGWIHNYDITEWGVDAWDAEGIDKENTVMLFGQDRLIKTVAEANPNTIVVLIGGGPVDMGEWIGDVKAVVQAWYPGMEGGNAIANILFGRSNPSGKLPMTFAKRLVDNPAHSLGEFPGQDMKVNYREGIFAGYRYFDSYDVEPRFCFGHGLSYTTFEYEDLKIDKRGSRINVSCRITNTGNLDGAETVQVYIRDPEPGTERPYRELKGFRKVFLSPGQSETVTVELNSEDFRYFDEKRNSWHLEPGTYEIQAGSSSRDIRLTGEISF